MIIFAFIRKYYVYGLRNFLWSKRYHLIKSTISSFSVILFPKWS